MDPTERSMTFEAVLLSALLWKVYKNKTKGWQFESLVRCEKKLGGKVNKTTASSTKDLSVKYQYFFGTKQRQKVLKNCFALRVGIKHLVRFVDQIHRLLLWVKQFANSFNKIFVVLPFSSCSKRAADIKLRISINLQKSMKLMKWNTKNIVFVLF